MMRALPERLGEHLRAFHARLAPGAEATALHARRFALLVVAAVALVTGHYYGQAWYFRDKLAPRWLAEGRLTPATPASLELWGLGYQASALLVIYGLVPVTLAWLALRIPLRELALVPQRRILRGFALALAGLALAAPVLYLASRAEGVQAIWPLYRAPLTDPAAAATLASWDLPLLLLGQVLAVELLLRGVLVGGLYPVLGPSSVLVAAVPFAMLNFGNLPMALLAFVGALVLGWLTLAARSLYPAVLLHWGSVVLLEHFCTAAQKGG